MGLALLVIPLLALVVAYQQQKYRANHAETKASSEYIKRIEVEKKLKQRADYIKAKTRHIKAQDRLIKAQDEIVKAKSRFTPTGYGSTVSSTPQRHGCSGYVPGQCVWGACQWLSWIPDGWGSAYEWDDNARAQGFYVGPVPKVGAVGQTDANHVVIVLKVSKGQVMVKGMNEAGPYTVKVYWTPISRWTYIY